MACAPGQWCGIPQRSACLQNSGADFFWIHHSVSGRLYSSNGFSVFFHPEQGLWGSGFSSPTFNWVIYFSNWTYVGFGLYWVSGIAILLTVRDAPICISPLHSSSS